MNDKTRLSTNQSSRFLNAMNFDYVKVDERDLDDLVLQTVRLSKLIRFYNTQNQPQGDWSEFFTDELVVLAIIKNIQPNELEGKFKNNISKANSFNRLEKKLVYLTRSFENIYQVILLFENWFQQLKSVEEFANTQLGLRSELFSAIEDKLCIAFQMLAEADEKLTFDEDIQLDTRLNYACFSPIWYDDTKKKPFDYQGDTLNDKVRSITRRLESIFQTFYETLLYLKNKANYYLDLSLKSDFHYPNIALLIAFLRLYSIPQKNINDISERYLDFYYQNVLQQTKREAVPSKIYLQFLANENSYFVNLPQGQAMIAGEYETGDNILFHTDEFLQVNKAIIKELKSIYADFQEIIVRGLPQKLVSNLLCQEIPMADVTPNQNKQIPKIYAPFGENQTYKSPHEQTMKSADLGFAISSPSLLLSEGKREIAMTFQFSTDSFNNLTKLLEDLSQSFAESDDAIFIKSFLEAFHLSITGTEGWFRIEKYVVTRNKDLATLKISFDLENDDPPIVNFNPEVHEGNYESYQPIVRFVLNNQAYIYPYSLLKDLIIEQVLIQTEVIGVKDLKLHSQMGELSPDSPFYPFGAIPNLGAFLIIGKNEIFQKAVDKLRVNIEWFNLPKGSRGFAGHYETYNLDLDNTSFEVDISILDRGRWLPENPQERQRFKVFRTRDNPKGLEPKPDAELSEYTAISNIDITKIKLPPNYKAIDDELIYNSTVQRGFIKLELCSPSVAFAHSIYPSVLSETLSQNSKISFVQNLKQAFGSEKKELPMPPEAYSPQIKSISLDYSSSAVVSFQERVKKTDTNALPDYSRGQFFHIRPFGVTMIYPGNPKQFTKFIPDVFEEGSLLIGLDQLQLPQSLSILFEMEEGAGLSSDAEKAEVEWYYLANNEWLPLAPSKILKDETEKFIKTGVVVVDLPIEMTKGNEIMNPNYYWLKVAVMRNLLTTSKLKSICTQVVSATLDYNPDFPEFLDKNLPAFSVETSLDNIPGLQAIIQPFESFKGRSPEDTRSFYTRVSERLRHKQRAITPWDFERLTLEKFPSIYKATCLPNMTSKNLNASGSVLVVVTPLDSNTIEPQASSELLFEIKEYLQQFVSPFVRVEVRNPSYEKVKVICDIRFNKGFSYGYYSQQLNEQINQFLTANLLGNRKAVELGGKISSSDVLSFMRALPYVDFVTKFSMIQTAKDFRDNFILLDTADEENQKNFLQATKPWSVLIPAKEHQLFIIDARNEIIPTQAGVSNLEVGNDFIIS